MVRFARAARSRALRAAFAGALTRPAARPAPPPRFPSELDIMFNIEKAHFILEEMVTNGQIVTTNKTEVLKPILLLEKLGGGK